MECSYLGRDRARYAGRVAAGHSEAGTVTRRFYSLVNHPTDIQTRLRPFSGDVRRNLIDRYIYSDLQAHGITPAAKTTDYEFIRRVTLDLTGRIPTAESVTAFLSSPRGNKRVALVERLLGTPEWVDKWTMYYGDLFKNTVRNVQVNIQPEGRNGFYKWIHDSIASGKPYDRMATELLTAQGRSNLDQSAGQMNYLALGFIATGPPQDTFDSQAANIAEQFLGLTHVNCLLCHDGRGHLDSLNLWASQTTRAQVWGLSAFIAHTWTRTLLMAPDPRTNVEYGYWALDQFKTDYALNTTAGNRPPRQPIGSVKTISPRYIFGGGTPAAGEDYRAALARLVTSDFQFARAAVNYIWAQFFGVGIVDPPDQFDPARLDPDNPPPASWTLQPTNPGLLNALAQYFIDSGYNIKALQRLIVTSDTYQLASEYSGNYDPSWDKYFARKFVRRLWAEEIHDSIVTATHTLPTYTVPGFSNDSTVYGVNSPGFGKISYAMQAPDVVNVPDFGPVSQFLDAFLRGNRDDQPRRTEGSALQSMALMNDPFVQKRVHAGGSGATATYMTGLLSLSDTDLVNRVFMDVLSRPPDSRELNLSIAQLKAAQGGSSATTAQRTANAEDLLWALFNKVDFVFNY